MKLFFALIVLMVSGAAWAQPPEVLPVEDYIEMGVGDSRTLRFKEPFKTPGTASDIVQIIPHTDHVLTITGLAAGQTFFYVRDDQERIFYTATISILQGAGHLVKIYGHRGRDFRGYYCNDAGCGRSDLDKKLANGGRDPDEPNAISVTQPTGGGGYTTRQYGPN